MNTQRLTALSFLLTILFLPSLSYAQTYLVKRVLGNNTIQLSNGERVRLIGVDTPETKHLKKLVEYFGMEATAFTRKMIEGKIITLKYDWQSRDKYGHTLAYVYLKDGTFLNAEIIKQGYGYVSTRLPFKYSEQFKQYEREARENKRGLWADSTTEKNKKLILEKYVGAKNSHIYHRPTCIAAQRIPPGNMRVFYSVKEAVDAGYVPCKICRPPYYR